MRSYGTASLRQKAARVIWGGLVVLALSAVPAAAQDGSFHDLFGDGYKFLQKLGEGARISVPARSPAPEWRAFQTVFEDGCAVVGGEGQSVGKSEAVEDRQVPEKVPFRVVCGEGRGLVGTPR